MLSELDALRTAKMMLQQYGSQEAWRILMARAIDEHMAGNPEHRLITQQILSALHKLAGGPAPGAAPH